MTDDNLHKLADAISAQEGFYTADARPKRLNNPGDLRSGPETWEGQTGTDPDGFCIFESAAYGWRALMLDLTNHAARWPGQSLAAFVAGDGTINGWTGYAPASDSNDSAAYAAALAKALGCEISTKFYEL